MYEKNKDVNNYVYECRKIIYTISECSTLSDTVGTFTAVGTNDHSVTRQDERWKESCRAERRAIKLWEWKYREIKELYGKSQTNTDNTKELSAEPVSDDKEKSISEELIALQNQFFLNKVNYMMQHY
ncbi:uncharacterized protein TRIADDRAFT_52170 [Trichoplax adhaerens]|uniref:Uncharacterized protein n=1 Tax=Trichoplax adhaerens TaxID=10228 RepID=B3RLY7_TRIAD|nr:predicted protein [Trichoplax adhaerens]EDV29606.1 predicted protein [Trichoplax adhaerens]|eukprot:XP_002108808.1 predicted protein [Trichoplax adhaerens]